MNLYNRPAMTAAIPLHIPNVKENSPTQCTPIQSDTYVCKVIR